MAKGRIKLKTVVDSKYSGKTLPEQVKKGLEHGFGVHKSVIRRERWQFVYFWLNFDAQNQPKMATYESEMVKLDELDYHVG